MKKIRITIFAVFMFFSYIIIAQPEVGNPYVKPGSCYAMCFIPDEYNTKIEKIEVKAASSKVEIIPAQYTTISEEVLVKDAATRIERIPAEYETQTQSFVKGCPAGYEPEDGNLVAGGNCIRLVPVPAVYESTTEQVLVKAAATRVEVIPAKLREMEEQILIQPARVINSTRPAIKESVIEQVLIKEATTKIERKPALYKDKKEQIEIALATTKWVKRKADQNCLSADPDDCIVWCLVETPAVYQTITKKIRVGCEEGWTAKNDDCIRDVEVPAEYVTRTYSKLRTSISHTREKKIPAEYITVTKQIVEKPARFRTVNIPAEYSVRTIQKLKTPASIRTESAPVIMGSYTIQVRKGCPIGYSEDTDASGKGDCIRTVEIPATYTTRTFQKLVSPATTKRGALPAEYTTVSRRVLVKKGGFREWREIDCEEKISNVIVRKVQEALRSRGYDPGPSNNIFGKKTKAAWLQFQKDNDLSGTHNIGKTMKALGIDY